MTRFLATKVSKAGRYSLGLDNISGKHFLSIPVANRAVDYEEYYAISVDDYTAMTSSETLAFHFAEECRRREHDDAIILAPGSDRGSAI